MNKSLDIIPILKYKHNLSDRFLSFAVAIIKMTRILPKNPEFKIIRYQLIKSATSSGANYKEAQSASSLSDFRNKISISLKEISETTYWLQILFLILDADQIGKELIKLKTESRQLERILGSIFHKTKK